MYTAMVLYGKTYEEATLQPIRLRQLSNSLILVTAVNNGFSSSARRREHHFTRLNHSVLSRHNTSAHFTIHAHYSLLSNLRSSVRKETHPCESFPDTAMSKAILLVALCFLPALAMSARPNKNPFVVRGRVYCDTCLAGFETSASTFIPGTYDL